MTIANLIANIKHVCTELLQQYIAWYLHEVGQWGLWEPGTWRGWWSAERIAPWSRYQPWSALRHRQWPEPVSGQLSVSSYQQGQRLSDNQNNFSKICYDTYCFQHIPVGLTERKQALVDNIDAWAMWISPPIFVLFNLVYWVYYRYGIGYSTSTSVGQNMKINDFAYWLICGKVSIQKLNGVIHQIQNHVNI